MGHTDQKYVEALLSNDERLIREIYERFHSKIQKMVLQQGGNETDAKDIFQDALLAIYNRAKNNVFILTCPFEGFLYLVCKRKWVKELEKRNKWSILMNAKQTFDTDDTSSELVDDCMTYEARKALIVQQVAKLGEKCKQLLRLSWEENTMEEVATLLNVSYGYARKKKSECMARLIELIHQSPDYNSLKW